MASKTAPQKPKNSTDAFARRQGAWRRERAKLDLDLEQAPLEENETAWPDETVMETHRSNH